jgi:hypothetical protein
MRLKRGANQCKIVSQWSQATSAKAATFGIQDGACGWHLFFAKPFGIRLILDFARFHTL